MAYATQADIEGELQGVTFPIEPVTVSVLSGYLDQESALIDQHIGVIYELPITDTSALLYLKKICIDLVVYRVIKVLASKSVEGDNRDISREKVAYDAAIKVLEMIESGDKNLAGATRNSTQTKIISGTPASTSTERIFKKDTVQW